MPVTCSTIRSSKIRLYCCRQRLSRGACVGLSLGSNASCALAVAATTPHNRPSPPHRGSQGCGRCGRATHHWTHRLWRRQSARAKPRSWSSSSMAQLPAWLALASLPPRWRWTAPPPTTPVLWGCGCRKVSRSERNEQGARIQSCGTGIRLAAYCPELTW